MSIIFFAIFKTCGVVLDVDFGRQTHAQTILFGRIASALYLGNTMLDLYVTLFVDQATPRFELGKKDLQSPALPLGHVAKTIQKIYEND
jgi:predicted Co/Zn/Cd cation transporter (cation efflux family)